MGIAIILTIINKLTTPEIHWAALANSGIIYIWITVRYSINKRTNIAGHVMIQAIAISLLTTYIDYNFGFKGWSLEISIPIIIMIANVTMLVLTIVSHRKYMRYAIYQLIICIYSLLPIYFIQEELIDNYILSYIAIGISEFYINHFSFSKRREGSSDKEISYVNMYIKAKGRQTS